MKRRDLVQHPHANGCELLHEGGRHSVYWNPANRKTSAVPGHSEISENLAKRICKDLEIPVP